MTQPIHMRQGINYSGNSFSATYADSVIGTILAYGGSTAPYGWFLCQGQAISRTEYHELFEVIGTSFGVGDGSTTFNLPDLRGEFLRGAGNNSHANQGNGGVVGEHQDGTETPFFGFNQNTGDLWCQTSAGQNLDISLGVIETDTLKSTTNKTGRFWNQTNTFTSDGSSTYTSRPTNTSVNFIIKAKYSASPAGDVLGVQDIRDTLGETPIPSDLGTTVTGALSNIGNRFNYSTEEQVVGKWIDGKPLYEKTFDKVNIVPITDDRTWVTIQDLSSMNIAGVLNQQYVVEVWNRDFTQFYFLHNGHWQDYNGSFLHCGVVDGNIIKALLYKQLAQGNAYKVRVTLQYTKTTD